MRWSVNTLVIVAAIAFAAVSASAQGPRPGGGPRGGDSGGGGGGGGGSGNSNGLVIGFNADQIAQIHNAAGFKSEVVNNNGIKMVRTLFWPDAPDIFAGAYGTSCGDKGQCAGMSTFANLGKVESATPAWVAAWNTKLYYVRSYVTKEGNLIFDWDILLVGVSPDDVVLTTKLFKQIVDSSTDFKP
jgi:hypothetical protein